MSLDNDDEDPKPAGSEEVSPKRSLSDQKVTTAASIPHGAARGKNLPALAETVQRRLRWAAQKLVHRTSPTTQPPPDHSLLTDDRRSTESRPVKEQLLINEGNRTFVGWRISDHTGRHSDGLRTARLFDPEGAFVLDALVWFGGSVLLNPADGKNSALHYLYLFSVSEDQVSARQVLGDAQPGEILRGTGNHYDYSARTMGRRTTIKAMRAAGYATGEVYRGREHAIRTALRQYEKNHGRSAILLTREAYEILLRLGFEWFDELRDAEHAATPKTAE